MDTGRRASINLLKEDLANTVNGIKHGYEIAVRKDNKSEGKARKKLFFYGHLKK